MPIYANIGGSSKQLISIYSNMGGSQKEILSVYSNINSTSKEIFRKKYRYGKYTYSFDHANINGVAEAGRMNEDNDVLADIDGEYVGSYPDIVKVFLNDFYVSKSYSATVNDSDSTVTVTLTNPLRVDVSDTHESYYFNGNYYRCSSGINGYWILENGQTSYTSTGRSGYHIFGYYVTWFGIGWSSSVGGNEARYSNTIVSKFEIIRKLTKTEYIDCDTKKYTSTNYAGWSTLTYSYTSHPAYGVNYNTNDIVYHKLLN